MTALPDTIGSLALPDIRGPFERDVVRHYIAYFTVRTPSSIAGIQHASIGLSWAGVSAETDTPPIAVIERLLATEYLAPSRTAAGHGPPARDVDALARATRYRDWPHEVLVHSQAKRLPRVIYRSPWRGLPMSIAETRLPDGGAREIEVAVARDRSAKAFDFYVYGADGKLASTSDFGTLDQPIHLSAPQICLRCHYDAAKHAFIRRPVFAPARAE